MPSTTSDRVLPTTSIDTEHNDMINDIKMDYYGKRLVTCSADRSFRVYDVAEAVTASGGQNGESTAPSAEKESMHVLQHSVRLPEDSIAPAHRIAWAHPKFGSLLAVGCQDGKVYIFREELHPNGSGATDWFLKHIHSFHSMAILGIAWSPYEYGLCLACASADGQVSFLTRMKEGWVTSSSFTNSEDGVACTSVSWAPYNSLGSQGAEGPLQRVVAGSVNHLVKIWQYAPSSNTWQAMESALHGHQDWVREVAWAPNVGIPANIIASASDDHTVRAWAQNEANGEWKSHIIHSFRSPVYRISWSLTGTILSAAAGDDEVTFWRQVGETSWEQVTSITETGAACSPTQS